MTTHKIDLLDATRDMFDYLDPYAELCGEISCISKRNGRLEGYAKDPTASGLAWKAFVEPGYWGPRHVYWGGWFGRGNQRLRGGAA